MAEDRLFRVYVPILFGGEDAFDKDGYPVAWQGIKHIARDQAGNRCLRCNHPYAKGDGEWSACDDRCGHAGPIRYRFGDEEWCDFGTVAEKTGLTADSPLRSGPPFQAEARWRILTVHHLDGVKANCRWWNLAPLCQRCHLLIQRKVVMNRPWPWPHTEWFQPYAAGFYALKYLSEELSRAETMARLAELLALGVKEEAVERMPL